MRANIKRYKALSTPNDICYKKRFLLGEGGVISDERGQTNRVWKEDVYFYHFLKGY